MQVIIACLAEVPRSSDSLSKSIPRSLSLGLPSIARSSSASNVLIASFPPTTPASLAPDDRRDVQVMDERATVNRDEDATS